MTTQRQFPDETNQQIRHFLSQQSTIPSPTVHPSSTPTLLAQSQPTRQRFVKMSRLWLSLLAVGLLVALYFIWRPASPEEASTTVMQQNVSLTPRTTKSATDGSGTIQVYIVGAIKQPGVYKLATNARIYQLLEAAGGPLPDANLVALNMAARLNDGQEVYVTRKGEIPPTYMGGVPGSQNTTSQNHLTNINTASETELAQQLHISSTNARKIVDYRLQHGPFTAVDQLMQVVSSATYQKIKDLVTIE